MPAADRYPDAVPIFRWRIFSIWCATHAITLLAGHTHCACVDQARQQSKTEIQQLRKLVRQLQDARGRAKWQRLDEM